jgi:hypothetical protein
MRSLWHYEYGVYQFNVGLHRFHKCESNPWSWPVLGRPVLDQFALPFDRQDAGGALPDSVTHSEVLYNFVKPPIHGWAFGRLRCRLPASPGDAELTEAYDRLARWTGRTSG